MFEDLIASRVRPLAAALAQSGLESVRVADGGTEIELRRGARPAEQAPAAPSTPAQAQAQAESPDEGTFEVLTAELVGRVRFPRPPVLVGASIDSDREIASIESLGIRNPIRSRGPGHVAVVYVEEGQAVDYGAPLFAIKRSER